MKRAVVFLALIGVCLSTYYKCSFSKDQSGPESWNDNSIWANCNGVFPNNSDTTNTYDASVVLPVSTIIFVNETVSIGSLIVGNNDEPNPEEVPQVVSINMGSFQALGSVSTAISGSITVIKSALTASNIANAGNLVIVDSTINAAKLQSNGTITISRSVTLNTNVSSEGALDINEGTAEFIGELKAVELDLNPGAIVNFDGTKVAIQSLKNQGNITWSNTTDWSPFAVGSQITNGGVMDFIGNMNLNIGARDMTAGTLTNAGKMTFYDDFNLFGTFWSIGQTNIYKECRIPIIDQLNTGLNTSMGGLGSLIVSHRLTWASGLIATAQLTVNGLFQMESHVLFNGFNFTLGDNSTTQITLSTSSSEPMFETPFADIYLSGNISLILKSSFQPREGDVIILFSTGNSIIGNFDNEITPKMEEGANSNGCTFEYQLSDTNYTMLCTIVLSPTSSGPVPRHASHGGAIAAGILVPLAVIGAAVGAYFYWKRSHNKGYRPL